MRPISAQRIALFGLILGVLGSALALPGSVKTQSKGSQMEKATFGAGCFWCVEAVFEELKGVSSVVSGYAGGERPNPTYKEVCSGKTGHAEVVQITYDPAVVSFEKLLSVFFKTHDPTTLNRQGNDIGTQYRSVIFFHSKDQQQTAARVIAELNKAGAFSNPIVTEVSAYTEMYEAEDYHQEYYANNGNQPYCRLVIAPKMEKFRKVFQSDLK